MTPLPSGVLVPVTTPFDGSTGEVALASLAVNARTLLDNGVDGLLATGSTGEAPLLSVEESRRIVSALREVVPADRHLMVGTGGESTRATVAACQAAGEEGADSVLVRAPAYFAPAIGAKALLDHFRAVADASPVPVFIYNMPRYTHVSITDTMLEALASHPGIVGAKDSSGDSANFAAYRRAVPHWTLLVGSGALLYAGLEMGGAGGIVAVENFAAELAVQVARAFVDGNRAEARRVQEQLEPLHRIVVGGFGPAGVKAAMACRGLIGGPVRAPLTDLDPAGMQVVRNALGVAELLDGS